MAIDSAWCTCLDMGQNPVSTVGWDEVRGVYLEVVPAGIMHRLFPSQDSVRDLATLGNLVAGAPTSRGGCSPIEDPVDGAPDTDHIDGEPSQPTSCLMPDVERLRVPVMDAEVRDDADSVSTVRSNRVEERSVAVLDKAFEVGTFATRP